MVDITPATLGPVTKAHFEAIGRVANAWSRLELFAQTLIAGLAELPQDTALIVTNSGTVRSWMETIRRLVSLRCPPDLCDECKKLTKEIEEKLYADRNKVIHGIWGTSWHDIFGDRFQPPDGLAARVKTLKKFGKEMLAETDLTASEVHAIADRITKALDDLQWLAVVLIDASRGTHS